MTAIVSALPHKKAAVVAAVAGGASVEEAARRAGVSARQAFRYMREPQVRSALREMRDRYFDRVTGRLVQLIDPALDTLERLQSSKNDNVRLGAAKALCEFTLRFTESVALTQRIQDLEQTLGDGGAGRDG